jgi:hypothetical protein
VALLANKLAISNQGLDRVDDALFALDLAGKPGTTVVFDEYDHGFGRTGSGLAGLPLRWRVGLGILLLALLLWMVSAGRRFGPTQALDRGLPPPRVAYVEAMGAALASYPAAQRADAAGPLLGEARQELARRLNLPDNVSTEALEEAAGMAGMAPGIAAALSIAPQDDAMLVASGRAAVAVLAGEVGPAARTAASQGGDT